MAQPTTDDAFHEIQLNGKQLVFLFMAATVVSVVIFLCGVLVGRGVRAERGSADGTVADVRGADVTPVPGSGLTKAVAREAENLSYFKRLEPRREPVDDLKPQAVAKSTEGSGGRPSAATGQSPPPAVSRGADTSVASKRAGRPVVSQASSEPAAVSDASATPVPPGPGYAVQIAALNVRSEADAIVRRLSAKGYKAYVLAPAAGTPSVYRVRIGSFKTRREAESVAAKLEQEEAVKPWVTR